MLRLDCAALTVAVRAHSVDEALVAACFAEQFRSLLTMFFRPELKIYVVQQTAELPEICLVAIAQLLGHNTHYSADSLTVVDVEFLFVVLLQKFKCFIPCHFRLPPFFLFLLQHFRRIFGQEAAP